MKLLDQASRLRVVGGGRLMMNIEKTTKIKLEGGCELGSPV